jgi:2-polyprenyl-3-methyl-5-hydroxy-6-metoxy-1,4-benzoquinol methylase
MKNEWTNIADKASKIQGTKNEVLNPVMMSLVKRYAKGRKLFDYGCGWGEFADIMQKEGFAVSAFDDADEMVSQAKSKFSIPTFLYKKDFNEKLSELGGTFDVVTSNLVLCILEKEEQDVMLGNIKTLVKDGGVMVISFCHPKYDYLPDSLVSTRISPKDAKYSDEFIYEKEIKENGVRFHDWHRPLEYYVDLFRKHGLKVLDTKESDVLGTENKPDFIAFVFSKGE